MSDPRDHSRSADMFYDPPPILRQVQRLLLQREMLEKEKQIRLQQIQKTKISAEHDDCEQIQKTKISAEHDDCAYSLATNRFGGGGNLSNFSNLDRFLKCTTPIVPGQQFSKVSKKGWSTQKDEFQPYFVLGDLWESFKEWSAYGAGVPLLLNGSDFAMQYYVPFLSGIQLYIDPLMPAPGNRGILSQQDSVEDSRQRIRELTVTNKTSNCAPSGESEFVSSHGVLSFEYFEDDPPFGREPLTTKISLLASQFPELNTYRSCDLSPASWICVAWYPIYRIPTGQTLQKLDSSFLTFHSLSAPIRGAQNEWQSPYGSQPSDVADGFDMGLKLSLPTFGLASYKFNTAFWEHTEADGYTKADLLLQAADNWLDLLNVCLPDYMFFASHNSD